MIAKSYSSHKGPQSHRIWARHLACKFAVMHALKMCAKDCTYHLH